MCSGIQLNSIWAIKSVTDLWVKCVGRRNTEYRRQLLQPLGSRVSAWWNRLNGVGYLQWDGTQLVPNVLLHGRRIKPEALSKVIPVSAAHNKSKSASLTWSWNAALVHTWWRWLCSSTSSVWVYSGSKELRPRKLTRWGRPSFLRSVSASKCTNRAWREQRGNNAWRETEMSGHTQSKLTRGSSYIIWASKREVAVISVKWCITLHRGKIMLHSK